MSIRSKTKRRLMILLMVVVVGVGLVGAVVAVRVHQINAEAEQWRADGLAAAAQDDYATAVDLLGRYLRKHDEDVEVLLRYAQSRVHVEMPNGKHIALAISTLRSVLANDPKNIEATRLLLDLYTKAGFNTETITIADGLLAQFPDDAEALSSKAIALVRMRKLQDALAVSMRCNEVAPLDYDTHWLTALIMLKLGRPVAEILDRAAELRAKYPEDPWFELLQGHAYTLAENREEAAKWLRAAALRPPPSPEFIESLVRHFDAVRLFNEGLQVLEKSAAANEGNLQLQQMLIRRLWQADRADAILDRLSSVDAASPQSDSELLAFRALALIRLGRVAEAQPIVDALSQRKLDTTAKVWSAVLKVFPQSGRPNPKQLVDACNEALSRVPTNPYIRYFLGEGYVALNEQELALSAYREAGALAPAWVMPFVGMARVFNATGDIQQAIAASREAFARAPNNIAAAVTLAVAWAGGLDGPLKGTESDLMAFIDQVQSAVPNEEQTLAIKVALLAKAGQKDEAAQVIRGALAAPNQMSTQLRARLAGLSRLAGLGLEDRLLQQGGGEAASPQLAYAQALDRLAKGDPQGGLRLLEEAMAQHGNTGDGLAWRMNYAQYLEITRDERAKDTWESLAREYPDRLEVQRAALESASAWADRGFIDQTIERVRQLGGERGLAWREARARWLLGSDQPQRDVPQAAGLLNEIIRVVPDRVPPRLLMARCMELMGNLDGAIENLSLASNLDPRSRLIALDLARLLQAKGEFDRARDQLERVVKDADTRPDEFKRAAMLLARQGETDEAIQSLLQAQGGEPQPDLLLAELYRMSNQLDKAEVVYGKLLETPNLATIRSAADFYASQGREEEAKRILALLDQVSLPPGVRLLAIADYTIRHVGPEQAMAYLQEATKEAPTNPAGWRLLVLNNLRLGKVEEALAAARDAMRALPDDETFRFLVNQSELLRGIGDDVRFTPLMVSLVEEPENRAAAVEVISLIAQAQKQDQLVVELLPQLRMLADRSHRFLLLQNILVQMYTAVGQYDNAIAVSTRTMQAFPQNVRQTQLAAETLAAARRWDEAIGIAEKWREQSPNNTLPPDALIAEAYLWLGNPTQATQRLSPYLQAALENPDRYTDLISLYARSLLMSGKAGEVASLLEPLLPQGQDWRKMWVGLSMGLPAHQAEGWLQRVEPLMPPDSFGERLILVEGWHVQARRSGSETHWQKVQDLLSQMIALPDVPAEVVAGMGTIAEERGDRDSAGTWYRKALQLKPDLPVAQNNLAMIIVDRGGDLNEAMDLATRAVRSNPNSVAYLDTLAQVQAKMNDYPAAIATMRKVVQLQPNEPLWQLGLAGMLLDGGDATEARKLIETLEASDQPVSPLPESIRTRLHSLRVRLEQASSQAAGTAP